MDKRLFTGLAVAGTLALATPVMVHAWGGGERCADGPRAGMMHKHAHYAMQGKGGGEQMGRQGRGQGMMGALQLSDEQRSRIGELRAAQAPAMREQAAAAREARRELRALSMSADYDEAKARAISERAAKASAEMSMLRAKAGNEFFNILTPEQRQQFTERMASYEQRGMQRRGMKGGGMHGHGHGMHGGYGRGGYGPGGCGAWSGDAPAGGADAPDAGSKS